MYGYNCGWWGPGYFFGWPWGMLVGIVFWGLIVYGIYRIISSLAKRQSGEAEKSSTPLDILKTRYAAGEIDAEEFAKRKKDLEQ